MRSKPAATRISPAGFRAVAAPSRRARSSASSVRERRFMRGARAPLPGPLLVITDRHQARHPLESIAVAVGRGGGRWLLFRDKDLAAPACRDLALRLAQIAAEYDVALSVSTDVDLAAM